MILQRLQIDGRRCVAIEEREYRRLARLARQAEDTSLPALPSADATGNVPALKYMRASIGRDVVKERKALGLSQEQLAALAGLRQETLSRLESGKHSPTVRTVEKIERALQQAQARASRSRGR